MRRENGKTNFDRNWDDYKRGFGNMSAEFWLGNARIHALTVRKNAPNYVLRVAASARDGKTRFVQYEHFVMRGSADDYTISFGQHYSRSRAGAENHDCLRYARGCIHLNKIVYKLNARDGTVISVTTFVTCDIVK